MSRAHLAGCGGHFLLHQLAGGHHATVVGESALKWAVLEDDDEIVIGSHRLRFEAISS